MKTTLDLPDDLLLEAKSVAVRRRTTLKAIFEKALRNELRPDAEIENPDPAKYEVNELGYLVLKRPPGSAPVTSEMIRTLQAEIDEEEYQRAINPRQ
jgi:hypothetical protein